jgi:O-acetyl-ADP-ribose deacetylase (regulator of RNase III)
MITMKGDITNVVYGIVCQQVNTKGVMGAGVARDIRRQWVIAYSDYMMAFNTGKLQLGEVIFSNVIGNRPELQVANMVSQSSYGNSKSTGVIYTDYQAFEICLNKIKIWQANVMDGVLPVYLPYRIGCGLAGGNWDVVKHLIEEYLPKAILVKKD